MVEAILTREFGNDQAIESSVVAPAKVKLVEEHAPTPNAAKSLEEEAEYECLMVVPEPILTPPDKVDKPVTLRVVITADVMRAEAIPPAKPATMAATVVRGYVVGIKLNKNCWLDYSTN